MGFVREQRIRDFEICGRARFLCRDNENRSVFAVVVVDVDWRQDEPAALIGPAFKFETARIRRADQVLCEVFVGYDRLFDAAFGVRFGLGLSLRVRCGFSVRGAGQYKRQETGGSRLPDSCLYHPFHSFVTPAMLPYFGLCVTQFKIAAIFSLKLVSHVTASGLSL